MVSTFQIKPSVLLQPYISRYALRIFNTGDFAMPKPLHAIKESYLTFELKGNSCFVTTDSGKRINSYTSTLCPILTQSNGCTWYKGDYILLSVQLKANGIPAIFGIPQVNLVNNIFCAEDILGNDNKILTEQLASYNNILKWVPY